MTYDEQAIVEHSNLEVYGRIKQMASQGSDTNYVVKVGTLAPITGTGAPDNGTPVTVPGQIYIDTSTNTSYVYTGTPGVNKVFVALGDPSFANTIEVVKAEGTALQIDSSDKSVDVTRESLGINDDKVTLNETTSTLLSTGSTAYTIYAPTVVGWSGQLLVSNGYGAPGWTSTAESTTDLKPLRLDSSGSIVAVSKDLVSAGSSSYYDDQTIYGAKTFDSAVTLTTSGSISNNDTAAVSGGVVYTALTNGTVTKISGWSSNTTIGSIGGTLKPIYLSDNKLVAGTQLYNNKVSINDSTGIVSTSSSEVAYYMPTSQGTQYQSLRANANGVPVWEDVDTTVQSGSEHLVTSGAVWTAINNLPEPMVFKGTVGTSSSATISYSDTTSATYKKDGWTFKAIADGTVNTDDAVKIGDTIIYNGDGASWVVIPSGDEPSGTVTSVAVGTGLVTDQTNSEPITTSGTISLASSYQTQHYSGTINVSNATTYTVTDIPFEPRVVQIYDPNGIQILARTEISGSGTNWTVSVTTALSIDPSQTWDVNVIGW